MDNKKILLTKEQSKKVNELIRCECCNYDSDTKQCIALDCVCPQTITYSHIFCKWFKEAVLPSDKDLELSIKIYNTPHCEDTPIGNNIKTCTVCGKKFESNSNRAKYCDRCRDIVRREKNANYQYNFKRKK